MSEEILDELASASEPMSASELAERTGIARRTLLRRLSELVEARHVEAVGRGRARRYALRPERDLDAHFAKPHIARAPVGWDRAFLQSYVPNETHYLSASSRAELRSIGAPESTLPAGTYARRILDRLLIDLSWNSSRLEGNTYSLLDTEELLLRGREPEGHSRLETQMVLNHKAAIDFLVDNPDEFDLEPWVVRNLHALLAEALLADPGAGGRLRRIPVQISGSSFTPLANPQQLADAFDELLQKARAIEDPFEASLFVLVQIPYLQPFVDVNKRVSRLAANIPFIRGNLYPLSFLDTPRDEYLHATLAVYELQHVDALAELFVKAYARSAQKYAVVAQSLGDPDPLRTKYRDQLKLVVGHAVRELVGNLALDRLIEQLDVEIESGDEEVFLALVREELAALHEGNFARYRLRPSEFRRWRDADLT